MLQMVLGYIRDEKRALAGMRRLGDSMVVGVYGEQFDEQLAQQYFGAIGLDDYGSVKRYTRAQLEQWGGEIVATPAGYLATLTPDEGD